MTVAALIVAAGRGSRMGGPPKQFRDLGGRPVLAHSYRTLAGHPAIDEVLAVVGAGQEAALAAALGDAPYVLGGATRRESVRAGLDRLAAEGRVDRVLIHDAARPFVPAEVISRLVTMLDRVGAAVPVLPVADTLARTASGAPVGDGSGLLGATVDRSDLARVQTPQAFRLDAILRAHRAWPTDEEATDDAQIARRAGQEVALVPGDPGLDKLTRPADFAAAEARFAAGLIARSATGFDVHRLADGEELWLGGVRIPHDRGLAGHSDADVALHALTDALLGTIADGDIGYHFPPSDPQWRGAASDRFLAHAAGRIRAAGGIIDFVDLTLICEAPRIGPHRAAIRARIAELLTLDVARVSVKATTTERLGFTGRGEGIAAQAIATVRLPGA